jgi:hypothetical protein
MKKYLLLCIVTVIALTACKNNSAKNQNSDNAISVDAAQTDADVTTFSSLDKLMEQAESFINKPVKVAGYVTHTCKHSGRRCFITDDNQKFTVRVEAKGKIGGFNRELTGSKINVSGILREKQLTSSEIDKMEKAISEKQVKNDGSEESCVTETANINAMRAWMKDHGKSYYAIYYIDGDDYREVRN